MPFVGEVAIRDDKIAGVGMLGKARAALELDATGLAVAPGFIDMLSWAVESLIEDGKSESDIRQGATLEVFGERWLWGPVNKTVEERRFLSIFEVEQVTCQDRRKSDEELP